jgi:hypothetical protein
MIGEAIQAVIVAIIPNTYPSIGDEGIEVPFCVHEEKDEPIYLKEGIAVYIWNCEVAIIHSTPDAAETLAMQVKTAIEALAGTTNHTTIIETVSYEGGDPGFDQGSREYLKILRFIIQTKNR